MYAKEVSGAKVTLLAAPLLKVSSRNWLTCDWLTCDWLDAAMAQRKSELLRLQTLERIAGFQHDLEGQLHILLTNPELTSVQQQSS